MRRRKRPDFSRVTREAPSGATAPVALPDGWDTYVPTEGERRAWQAFWDRLFTKMGEAERSTAVNGNKTGEAQKQRCP